MVRTVRTPTKEEKQAALKRKADAASKAPGGKYSTAHTLLYTCICETFECETFDESPSILN